MSPTSFENLAEAHALPLTLIDLEQHPDGELLRLIVQATNAREHHQILLKRGYRRGLAIADRHEKHAAWLAKTQLENRIVAMPAKTPLALTAKALFTLEHEAADNPAMGNLTWGISGLLYSVVNDFLRLGGRA